jgi:hypothetical protein
MARQITLSTELSWQPKLARYFKTEPTVIVPFSFGISENTVFLNVIDSYHLVDERYIKAFFKWNCPQSYINLKWPQPFKRSGLRSRRRTYHTIIKLADHALLLMVRYVLLRPLRPERRSAVTSNKCMIGGNFIFKKTLESSNVKNRPLHQTNCNPSCKVLYHLLYFLWNKHKLIMPFARDRTSCEGVQTFDITLYGNGNELWHLCVNCSGRAIF